MSQLGAQNPQMIGPRLNLGKSAIRKGKGCVRRTEHGGPERKWNEAERSSPDIHPRAVERDPLLPCFEGVLRRIFKPDDLWSHELERADLQALRWFGAEREGGWVERRGGREEGKRGAEGVEEGWRGAPRSRAKRLE